MSVLRLEYYEGGVYLPELELWLDPHHPCTGPETVFISHAHSDHIGEHREVILSAPTSRLMRARLPPPPEEHVLEFGRKTAFQTAGSGYSITLLPAGHIFGSAMSLIEAGNESLLYTGDFKLRSSMSAERCEPRHADILIMETTFGRPQYEFPATAEVLASVLRFCREALANDETPVLLGYSLGKSQELLCGLGEAGLPIMLHGAVWSLTRIYEQFGQCFAPFERYDAGSARGKVLLCPPNVINSSMLRNLGKTRTAILTGWAVEPNCRYRYQCDAAFPLSDHADFPELLEFVKLVAPKKVYTLHGFAADFAQSLRERGYPAHALSEDEQYLLGLPLSGNGRAKRKEASGRGRVALAGALPSRHDDSAAQGFQRFALLCAAIAADSSKLEKVRHVAEYLRGLGPEEVQYAATWLSGRPFASSQNKALQLGWAVLRDVLLEAAGTDELALHRVYLKHSDLGETAFEILESAEVAPRLTLEEVHKLFRDLYAARGPAAKRAILREVIERCTALEAKFLVKIITGDLRIGLKEGLVEEAIAAAFGEPGDKVRNTNLLLGDIGQTARRAALHQLDAAELEPFRAVKLMLASPEPTAAAVWERVRQWSDGGQGVHSAEPNSTGLKAWLEDKYDGIRCQLHKVGTRVALYSRDLKDITSTFPELADAARVLSHEVILDGEIVSARGECILPFSALQRRLGRKEADLFMREEVPIAFVAFDVLWLDGEGQLARPLRERRELLENLVTSDHRLRLAQITEAASEADVEAAFAGARERGNEGLMIKDPQSGYSPGRRGLSWLKLKKAYATLDCVVIGAEFGHGKRSKVLSDYTFAVRDEATGELKTIGKAYTGLTDAEIDLLTVHFLATATRQHGRYFEVPPDTVLEIAFDRLQPSNRHNSGLAMRFPRIVRIRSDKTVSDIDTLTTAWKLTSPTAQPA